VLQSAICWRKTKIAGQHVVEAKGRRIVEVKGRRIVAAKQRRRIIEAKGRRIVGAKCSGEVWGRSAAAEIKSQVHAYILRMEAKLAWAFVVSVNNALITLYWKCDELEQARMSKGNIHEAKSIFNEISEKNMLSWTIMILGLGQHDWADEALKHFNKMKSNGLEQLLPHVSYFHLQSKAASFTVNLFGLASTRAFQLRMLLLQCTHDVMYSMLVTLCFLQCLFWILCLGMHGSYALHLFEEMLQESCSKDGSTTLLSACNHAVFKLDSELLVVAIEATTNAVIDLKDSLNKRGSKVGDGNCGSAVIVQFERYNDFFCYTLNVARTGFASFRRDLQKKLSPTNEGHKRTDRTIEVSFYCMSRSTENFIGYLIC
ncbi:hypothetical protein MIMGU_mgv11b024603mg, partial [Erythranthe guttata]